VTAPVTIAHLEDQDTLNRLASAEGSLTGFFPGDAPVTVVFGTLEHADDRAGVERAATLSGFASVVEELPLKWDTVLAREFPGGAELSGGQWQRLALARALFATFHGARILVLDEPTAALDVRAAGYN
jgi:ATP-binding cassette, subfamily B, bacterial